MTPYKQTSFCFRFRPRAGIAASERPGITKK
jgi:hypothetical protein